MRTFLKPDRRRIGAFIALVVAAVLFVYVLFRINERDIAELVLFPLFKLPIGLFDAVTGSAFAPRDCGFLCFPTLPQVASVVFFDIAVLYVIACAVVTLRDSRRVRK